MEIALAIIIIYAVVTAIATTFSVSRKVSCFNKSEKYAKLTRTELLSVVLLLWAAEFIYYIMYGTSLRTNWWSRPKDT